jgi:hypothetical protein
LKLGLEEVPVHVAVGLTPAQGRAYRLADNQTATLSQWDDDKLPLELAQLQEMDFDLNLTGFSADELRRLLDSGGNAGQGDPDAVPEPPDEPITQPGDLWLLGKHRLLCGDSSKAEDVDHLLGGAVIHRVNTGTPYTEIVPAVARLAAAGPLYGSPLVVDLGQPSEFTARAVPVMLSRKAKMVARMCPRKNWSRCSRPCCGQSG